jgi:4-hydroxybenzoate polyprenyltransferase
MHPWPSLATALAAAGFALWLGIRRDDRRIAVIAVTILITQLSISSLNDWADRTRDAAAGRRKPLVIGHTPPAIALAMAILFAVLALPSALAFGVAAGMLLLLGLLAGWAYDLWLKPTRLSFLPFAVAFPLLPAWVGLVAQRSLAGFAPLLLAVALLAVAIHLSDSLPDLESDARSGTCSLPVSLGFDGSTRLAVVCLLLGGLVTVVGAASRLWLALLIAVIASLGVWFYRIIAARRPEYARWIAGAFAGAASLALLPRA